MAETPYDGGGGLTMGGTASSMCAISPSDLVGTIGNLISRIEDLEFALSQVLGANLHANTLGDISSQVGWVYNVEYMGIPGWIQTEYGTLIPPAGFTLSGSGIQMWNACTGEFEDYQAVVMDSDGVLQWGASAAGNLCGAKVEEWNGAALGGTLDYYIAAPAGHGSGSRGITLTSSTVTTSGGHIKSASYTLTVSRAGVYSIGASCIFECNIGVGDTGTLEGEIEVTINALSGSDISKAIASNEFYNEMVISSGTVSNLHVLSAGDTINIEYSMTLKNGTLNSRAIDNIRIGIVRLTSA